MKVKILNISVILCSLVGYLEWGGGNSSFLFEAEIDILSKLLSNPKDAVHPFTIIPLIGQVLLIATLFQKVPSTKLTIVGILFLAVLLVFMTIIGLISFNVKIVLSTIPFLSTAILTIRQIRITRRSYSESKA